MPEIAIAPFFLKFISLIIRFLKWLVEFLTNRTKIEILLNRVDGGDPKTGYVFNEGGADGLFYVGITTKNQSIVEIKSIRVIHEAELFLSDPAGSAFFTPMNSSDPERPFAVLWQGASDIRAGLIKNFGMNATFQNGVVCRRVEIVVTAQKRKKFFSYLKLGALQETILSRTVELTDKPSLGILIPKLALSQTEQPFMQQACAGFTRDQNLIKIHTRGSGRTPGSQIIHS